MAAPQYAVHILHFTFAAALTPTEKHSVWLRLIEWLSAEVLDWRYVTLYGSNSALTHTVIDIYISFLATAFSPTLKYSISLILTFSK